MRTLPRVVLSLLVASALLASVPAGACGPYPLDTRFWFDDRPGVADHRMVRSQLGVFETQFDTAWIYTAWRQLAGPGMVESDREQLVWLLAEVNPYAIDDEPEPTQTWAEARKEVTGADIGWIETSRMSMQGEGESWVWNFYDNCLPGAFKTAAATLRARVAEHGKDDLGVREWLRGQDAVFENCGGGEGAEDVMPEAASPDWPLWLRHDRAYQMAATALYSERYDEAAERFTAIAADSASPWSVVSGYLVGRALARTGHYDQAIERFRAVLEEPAATKYHDSARGLIDHLLFRSDPDALREEVVARLSASPLAGSVAQDLDDFRRLATKVAFEGGETDSLTDWFRAVKGWTAPAEVVERWRGAKGTPAEAAWRWAALVVANATDMTTWDEREYPALPADTIQELLAAPTVEPGTAGAVTEAYHRARLLLDTEHAAEAVPIIERALQGWYGSVSTADTNRFLVQRLRAAPSPAELVHFGQMYPVEVGWNFDDHEALTPYDGTLPTWIGGPLWHYAAAQALNGMTPEALAELITPETVEDALLRTETLRTAWTRAVVLGDDALVTQLSTRLGALDPVLGPQLEPLLSASATERAFVAALIVLRNPGLHPDIHWGVGRVDGLGELDVYRNNWWCPGDSFLLPESGNTELAELPSAPIWLGPVVNAYADSHPDDPRVPEALHLVVRTTRHGCEWGETSFADTSKAAFQRLHQRYPKSPWTAKTPYWFE